MLRTSAYSLLSGLILTLALIHAYNGEALGAAVFTICGAAIAWLATVDTN